MRIPEGIAGQDWWLRDEYHARARRTNDREQRGIEMPFNQRDVVVSWVWINDKWVPVNDEAWVWSEEQRQWEPQIVDGWQYDQSERIWVRT